MDNDRKEMSRIIKDMLYHPDAHGTYNMTKACDELEAYVEKVRVEAIGWMYADSCVTLDKGADPRKTEVPEILERALVDLAV